jgi:hypothetical protein
MVGAVTLAYLLAAPAGREFASRPRTVQGPTPLLLRAPASWSFGAGGGGVFGIPRKAAHADLSADGTATFAAMGMAESRVGRPGAVARRRHGFARRWRVFRRGPPARRRDASLAIAATVLLVAGGWLPELLPAADRGVLCAPTCGGHIRADIELRFQQGS